MEAVVAQLVEHVLGKNEVSGSIPDNGSNTLVFVLLKKQTTLLLVGIERLFYVLFTKREKYPSP